MKNIFAVIAIALMIVVFGGCKGDNGQDGRVYLTFDWDYALVEWGSSIDIYSMRYGVNYEVSPGTYSFNYTLYDGEYEVSRYGYFTLVSNPGEEGKMFHDGDDGADRYYTLYFGWYDASLYKPLTKTHRIGNEEIKNTIPQIEKSFIPTVVRTDTVDGKIVKWQYIEKYNKHTK